MTVAVKVGLHGSAPDFLFDYHEGSKAQRPGNMETFPEVLVLNKNIAWIEAERAFGG